ncbi:HEPN domain-containing protein [bacterium]|nr:HEPN domain-containing protein [bacterium]
MQIACVKWSVIKKSVFQRALESLESAKDSLASGHEETAVSRAYYACFYVIHSKLSEIDEIASSHKQAQIEFRQHFIKTKLIDQKYSLLLSTLLRMYLVILFFI